MNLVLTPPDSLMIGSLGIDVVRFDLLEVSDATGAHAGRSFGPPRWRVRLAASPDMTLDQSSEWEALVVTLSGALNVLAVHDPVRPAPRGTMRGTLTLDQNLAAWSTSMVLTGATGTLLKGDWLQVGSGLGTTQCVKVVEDATAAADKCTVNFRHPIRRAYAAGTTIYWDRPRILCRQLEPSVGWDYQAGNMLQGGFAMTLLETFN